MLPSIPKNLPKKQRCVGIHFLAGLSSGPWFHVSSFFSEVVTAYRLSEVFRPFRFTEVFSCVRFVSRRSSLFRHRLSEVFRSVSFHGRPARPSGQGTVPIVENRRFKYHLAGDRQPWVKFGRHRRCLRTTIPCFGGPCSRFLDVQKP